MATRHKNPPLERVTQVHWYALSTEETLQTLNAKASGRNGTEAVWRLPFHGPNRLPEYALTTFAQVLTRQFKSPLIYIFALAVVLAAAIDVLKNAVFITAVLMINEFLGGYHKARAEKSSRALQKFFRITEEPKPDDRCCIRVSHSYAQALPAMGQTVAQNGAGNRNKLGFIDPLRTIDYFGNGASQGLLEPIRTRAISLVSA